jgi:hypothetical protein
MPGHSARTARIQRQPVRVDDDGFIRDGYSDKWAVVCRACDQQDAEKVRGPYDDHEAARTALELHIGLENDRTRLARELGLA